MAATPPTIHVQDNDATDPPALQQDPFPFERIRHRHILAHEAGDAPPIVVRWHYAVDVPKRRPGAPAVAKKDIAVATDKFVPFSVRDSHALEQAFQESLQRSRSSTRDASRPPSAGTKVPVNEDHLFEVDIEERELGPVYWRGPIYSVRRGTWHVADGSTLKPCDENLATQVEDGYLKVKPWKEMSQADIQESSTADSAESQADRAQNKTPPIAAPSVSSADKLSDVSDPNRASVRPLFGSYAGKYVLYTSKTTAWLLSDDLYGKISASFFQSVTRGVHMGGTKLMRGYTDAKAEKEKSKTANTSVKDKDKEGSTTEPAAGLAEVAEAAAAQAVGDTTSQTAKEADVGTGAAPGTDYDEGENPKRQIDHLILCCHGIGQKLGERLDSVNFIHDVNVLRRTIKQTYSQSKELQMLGPSGSSDGKQLNCGVQVLPVEWRQKIKFGMASEPAEGGTSARGEQDLAQGYLEEEEVEEHATLQDITVEGVQTIRHLISDALLDILLFYQPSYREKIIKAVAMELNRVYTLFRERNPSFHGKVSIFGHSLGSAITFDIVCRQPTDVMLQRTKSTEADLLAFDVDNLYCVGSPVGLFQMLRGKEIRARAMLQTDTVPVTPFASATRQSPFEHPPRQTDGKPASYPKVNNLFNIFHPSDPVAYRLEPLVSKHAAKLKPHPIPYTKAGFRQQLVGLSSIPQRALEGASSYWGALRSSITNSVISRSLGYSDFGAASAQREVTEEEAEEARQQQHAADKARVQGEMARQHDETLFASFDKAFGSSASEQGQRRKLEGERRLKALNRQGSRIDYAIQEDLIGSSYISALHSHLGYWSDVDVAHFLMSRLYTDDNKTDKS
ncbi:DDHD domain-domain-containing protein [Protomyces lactucae-debilis]|uniref:DDHD domain-domain-containing protein n=1 Tax=Protomyces lactucae-debilis TaxID=2754530 RepID=A0A1Y2FIR0_PROLT|nr:DDHD domain-containing protein [Protomyces lactucae-debilis]ORY83828.1 DDHD domain-domain-containing protein [Protomyces lactucae-debilis]